MSIRSSTAIVALLLFTAHASPAMAVYHARMGRFLQRDPLGHVDGMSTYEYVRSGPVQSTDPSGKVVIFVHGIKDDNVEDIGKHVYPELVKQWGGGDQQALVHFIYKPKVWTGPSHLPGSDAAVWGLTSPVNQAAGRELARVITHLHQKRVEIREKTGCDEGIHLILYSNGSNVGYHALTTHGASVTSVTKVGGSIRHDNDLTGMTRGSARTNIFWSPHDASATWYVDGIGYQGPDRQYPRTTAVEVPRVFHSTGQGTNVNYRTIDSSNIDRQVTGAQRQLGFNTAADREARGATTWLTRYMAAKHYSKSTKEDGIVLSRHGDLPNGDKLKVSTVIPYEFTHHSPPPRVVSDH